MTRHTRDGPQAAGPRSTWLRLPPQARPVDRSLPSAALAGRSAVEAASLASVASRVPWAIDWVRNHSFLPRNI